MEKVLENGETIVLSTSVPQFFGVDHRNTIMWSGFSEDWNLENGFYAARTSEAGGVSKSGIELPDSPDYFVIDGDGKGYMVHGTTVYQVFPFESLPVAEIVSKGGKKVIISQDLFYTIMEEEVLGLGSRDVIRITGFEDTSVRFILGGGEAKV